MSEVQDLWVEENYGIGTSLDEEVSPAAKPKESILLSHFHRIVPPIRLAEAYCQDIVTQTRDAHLRLKGQVAERLSNNTKNWLLGTTNGSMTLASLRHQVSSSKESNNEASDICPKNESNNCDWPRCFLCSEQTGALDHQAQLLLAHERMTRKFYLSDKSLKPLWTSWHCYSYSLMWNLEFWVTLFLVLHKNAHNF
jgi:hypothetical protein